jgi:hypothetical protein
LIVKQLIHFFSKPSSWLRAGFLAVTKTYEYYLMVWGRHRARYPDRDNYEIENHFASLNPQKQE